MTESALLNGSRIILVLTPANSLRESNLNLGKKILALGYSLIVVTTNYPQAILQRLYEQEGMDTSRIYYIDAITQYSLGTAPSPAARCIFVSSPANLTDMGIAITQLIQEMPRQKVCVLFDSVSTMVLYLQSESISKFIHFVSTKLRLLDGSGVYLAVEKGLDPKLLTQLTTLVDRVDEVEAG